MDQLITFSNGKQVRYIWQYSVYRLLHELKDRDIVLLTDEHVAACHTDLFATCNTIVIPAGEDSKSFDTVSNIVSRLRHFGATRKSMLIGIGGGVITDITGFVASVYMRGISFGMVPTSLLAMVDAAIGGKNGVNSGDAKNMVGTINQPDLIAFDPELLATLPSREWSGGFAEIIKYACLFDKQLFDELELHNIYFYKENISATTALIKQCVAWKNKVVLEDEHETGKRKLLNFGHTLAHALEKTYSLSHGEAVAIGMVAACYLSEQCLNLDRTVQIRLSDLLKRYGLPITLTFDVQQIMQLLKSDKKRDKDAIDYILLRHIGEPEIVPIHTEKIEKLLSDYASHY